MIKILKNIRKHILKNLKIFGTMEIMLKKQLIMDLLYMEDQMLH